MFNLNKIARASRFLFKDPQKWAFTIIGSDEKHFGIFFDRKARISEGLLNILVSHFASQLDPPITGLQTPSRGVRKARLNMHGLALIMYLSQKYSHLIKFFSECIIRQ